MNIGREYRYDWHDLMMEVRGPVVSVIDREFRLAWRRAGFLGEFGYLAESLWPNLDREAGTGYPLRMLLTKPGNSEIFRTQLAAIRAAESYIYIQNPYFSDDETLIALIDARRRGVDVRVILPFRGDSKVMNGSNVVVANTLFENSIRVFIYPGFSHVKAGDLRRLGLPGIGEPRQDEPAGQRGDEPCDVALADRRRPDGAGLRRRFREIGRDDRAVAAEPGPQPRRLGRKPALDTPTQ